MREFSKLAALAGGIAFAAGLAYAADQKILGKSLTVKNPTGDASQRFIKGSAKETGSSDTLVGNPTLAGSAGGAILEIIVNGTHGSSQSFKLPQGTTSTGKSFWTKAGSAFKYKDARGDNHGPVKSLIIKRTPNGLFSIKAKLTGKNGFIGVVPPNLGTSGCMALKLGQAAAAGDRYSVQFGPESKIKNLDGKVFSAKKPTAEGVCPTMYGSPSRAFLEKVESLLD